MRRVAQRFLSSAAGEQLKKTAFYDLHQTLKGKMVPFAGYELPVFYETPEGGVLKEHMHTRSETGASLFDVSHMGQIRWHGKDRVAFIEKMVVGDIAGLSEGETKLSLVMQEDGGIVDDTVITNAGDYIYMVVNGATKDKDMAHFKKYMQSFKGQVEMEYLENQQLVAIQGTAAASVVQELAPWLQLARMPFMSSAVGKVGNIENCRVTRCGYTGEDGFEISVDEKRAVELAETLLKNSHVRPAGLGCRDSLRLEAGLCLYGHDIDEKVNPVSASLAWTMGGPKSRRRIQQGFLGADKVLAADGKLLPVAQKRVGIMGMKAPAREGAELTTADGSKVIGRITSGTFSPCLKKPVAMGYVDSELSKEGTVIGVNVRGNIQQCEITKMPFVPTRYFKPQ